MSSNGKILYIVEAMGGGVFSYIVDLANELVNDFEVFIAYGIRSQTPINYKEYFDERVNLIEVKSFTREVNLIKDLKSFSEIRKIRNEVNPNIIHLHSSKAGVIGRWALNTNNSQIFYTPHGYSFLMEDCSVVKRKLFKYIEFISSKRKCITIACSKGEYLEAQKLCKNSIYVNNGINIEKLKEIICNLKITKRNKLTVFTLGRICYQKKPELFNEIANQLPDIDFIWIGDGELRSKLTASNIHITGWIDRKNALKVAMEADIFILTSLWEGLPISLLESMFMKKMCIVSDVIGNRDVIKNNSNGFICTTSNQFIEKIREINDSTAIHNSLLEKAYNDILNEYNTKVMASKYKEIYLNVNSERENNE